MEDSDVVLAIPEHVGDWSVDDLLALPETKAKVEISDGTLVVSPSPTNPHQWVSAALWAVVRPQVAATLRPVPDVDVVLNRTTVRRPDLALILKSAFTKADMLEASDVMVAVEIVSPSSRKTDRLIKPIEYAAGGIPGFWRIELEPEISLTAFALEDGAYVEVGVWGAGETAHVSVPVDVRISLDDLTWGSTD